MSLDNNNNQRGNKSVNDYIKKAISEHAGVLVKIIDFDPSKHLVRVVKLADNKPLLKDQQIVEPIAQKKKFKHTGEKALKTSDTKDGPILAANNSFASMRGNADYGFFSYNEGGGNIIKGPLSLGTEPHQIRVSGLTTFNPLMTSGFPSTIVTPIPTTVWALPTAGMIKPILKDLLVMGTLAAAAGSIS